jgi:hypothetical protein
MKLIISLILLIILISGCAAKSDDTEFLRKAISDSCISICNSVKGTRDLSNGPCLSDNNTKWTIQDWVCDVAHSPRIAAIDNLPENQCQAYRSGQAHHFVEVDPNCNFITSI